jgi:hypothetical protein
MRRQRGTRRTVAVDQVEDARREAGAIGDLRVELADGRRALGGLDHDRVARR